MEFGSGRGQLTFWLAEATSGNPGCCDFLLVDRASHRHKFDNKLRAELSVQRVRADIQDLVLGKVPTVQEEIGLVDLDIVKQVKHEF